MTATEAVGRRKVSAGCVGGIGTHGRAAADAVGSEEVLLSVHHHGRVPDALDLVTCGHTRVTRTTRPHLRSSDFATTGVLINRAMGFQELNISCDGLTCTE